MFEVRFEVTEDDLEPRYQHVNHARALVFLERARLAFLEEIGFPNDAFLEHNLFFVITAVHVRYKRELLQGGITVTCEAGRIDGRSVVLDQRILNDKGKEVIHAIVESKFMSGETRRSIPPPADFIRAMQERLSGPDLT